MPQILRIEYPQLGERSPAVCEKHAMIGYLFSKHRIFACVLDGTYNNAKYGEQQFYTHLIALVQREQTRPSLERYLRRLCHLVERGDTTTNANTTR